MLRALALMCLWWQQLAKGLQDQKQKKIQQQLASIDWNFKAHRSGRLLEIQYLVHPLKATWLFCPSPLMAIFRKKSANRSHVIIDWQFTDGSTNELEHTDVVNLSNGWVVCAVECSVTILFANLGESIGAQSHDDVTMLFSDLVGFTAICATATPMEVISLLQSLYTRFDALCGHLDVYKVTFDIPTVLFNHVLVLFDGTAMYHAVIIDSVSDPSR